MASTKKVDPKEADAKADEPEQKKLVDSKSTPDQPPKSESKSGADKPAPAKRKRSKWWMFWLFLIIVFSAAAAGVMYRREQQKLTQDHSAQAVQINSLQSQIATLKHQNTDLQGQVNTLKSSTTDLDSTAISTRVKYVYTQWLGGVGHDQTSLINTLKNSNYLTAAAASALRANATSTDPVICSQNPAGNYNYDAPLILTTTAASMNVTGQYSSGQNIAIKLALVKVVSTWEIDSISCP